MDQKCLFCLNSNNLIRIKVHCGEQICHKSCLEHYLTTRQTCIICNQSIHDKLQIVSMSTRKVRTIFFILQTILMLMFITLGISVSKTYQNSYIIFFLCIFPSIFLFTSMARYTFILLLGPILWTTNIIINSLRIANNINENVHVVSLAIATVIFYLTVIAIMGYYRYRGTLIPLIFTEQHTVRPEYCSTLAVEGIEP